MKLSMRTIAVLSAAMLSASFCSCEDKKSSQADSQPSEVTETAASDTTSASDVKTTAKTTETTAADDKDKKTETTSASETTKADGTTTAAAATTATADAQKPTKAAKKGFDSSFEAAKAYYNAYLKGDADAVYDMLCDEEIEAYHSYLRSTELLEGQNPQVVFKRSNVINAIKQSIGAIHGLMKEKSDVPPEKWTVSLTEELLRPTGENELKDFNKVLSTDFTAASDCGYVYYKDGNDDHSFIGNGCAFVELDGRWYLSYTTIMNAELITYLDIF
ncbi:hypothetical protein [Ruminococcus flavefaciens]|uniref:Uncharacterized protein n=1 Tax=Ruminococcus flavefaciens 007c TaxID=1341157 RepID=W7UHZ4_RUMFL|nr:hypothetical protein [Ruminococcus flavefaciens]EWM54841.1 hypothetical protein RF007C_10915 [Ruminococcus flavefaciens 007c]